MLTIVSFPKERLSELLTNTVWGLIEDDRQSALVYLKDVCNMSIEELEYCGVELTESEREEYEK